VNYCHISNSPWETFPHKSTKGHSLLKCPERGRSREHLLSRKWQIIDELAYKKIINCIRTVELKNLGTYLYKIKCKWEKRMKELHLDGD
jgi:hypothetical protein